jgi:phosphate transport system substrate-binding protein
MRAQLLSSLVLVVGGASCSKRSQEPSAAPVEGATPAPAGGVIKVDGSSTVFLISQAVAEDFEKTGGQAVKVSASGTGGGFKKLCRGEIDVAGASRPIKQSELADCKSGGIDLVELPVAYDGLAVVVNTKNAWVDKLTVSELKKMWAPEAQDTIKTWAQVRAGWPDKPLRLFGAGVDSGTYDYFTQAIVGKEHSSRGDFTSSEDDNVLVQGVSMDESALGFFGFAYYVENKDKLKVVPIDDEVAANGAEPVTPSIDTVRGGTYQPLSRPLFIYVSARSAGRAEVDKFVTFYLGNAASLAQEVGYVPLPANIIELTVQRYQKRTPGTVFQGGSQVGVTLEKLLTAEGH